MTKARKDDRTVLRITGADASKFLQDLVTNDIKNAAEGVVYASLLTPQGKYLFDFFVLPRAEDILIDIKADRAQALAMRLSMYKLRADVSIEDSGLSVFQVVGERPEGDMVFADPRDARLGWRVYGGDLPEGTPLTEEDWAALRVAHAIPETGIELIPDDSYILEAGFDRLHGVDFKKGCYVGQEVTARMRHKTELRKGLRRVTIDGSAAPGTPVLNDGKQVGTLYTTVNGEGLAHLRFDRLEGELTAEGARITPL